MKQHQQAPDQNIFSATSNASASLMGPRFKHYPNAETAFLDLGWRTMQPMFRGGQYEAEHRQNFGVLHVFNQGTIQPGKGYPMHPHDNMEIVTIPIKGQWEHRDTQGNLIRFSDGEVQVMSAGKGMAHSEFNASDTDTLTTMQFWLHTNEPNTEPRYEWYRYADNLQHNQFSIIVQPLRSINGIHDAANGARILQDAWFSIGLFDQNAEISYSLQSRDRNHGVFVYVLSGEILLQDIKMGPKDALGIENVDSIIGAALSPNVQVLVIEVPLL